METPRWKQISAGSLVVVLGLVWAIRASERGSASSERELVARSEPIADANVAATAVAPVVARQREQGALEIADERVEAENEESALLSPSPIRVIVVTSAGEELDALDGTLQAILRWSREGAAIAPPAQEIELRVVGGWTQIGSRFARRPPRTLEVQGGIMDGRAVTTDGNTIDMLDVEGSTTSIRVLQRLRARLRVVDARTGSDLAGVVIANGENVAMGRSFPGPSPDVILEEGVSPIDLEVDGWERFNPSVRVWAPGYAWAAHRLSPSEGMEQRIALEPGAVLSIRANDPGGVARVAGASVTVSKYAEDTGEFLYRAPLVSVTRSMVQLKGLPPGRYFVSASVVDTESRYPWSWTPMVLEPVDLAAGVDVTAVLDVPETAARPSRKTKARVRVVGADLWPEERVEALLQPRVGSHPDSRVQEFDVATDGSWTVLESIACGEYRLTCRALGYSARVTVEEGASFEIEPPEAAVVVLSVEGRTDVDLSGFFVRCGGRLIGRPRPIVAERGRYEIYTTPGRLTARGQDAQGRYYSADVEVAPGRNDVRLQPGAIVDLLLRSGGAPIPFTSGGHRPAVEVVSGPGRIVTTNVSRLVRTDRLSLYLSVPGTYEFDVTLPPGLRAASATITMVARHDVREERELDAIPE